MLRNRFMAFLVVLVTAACNLTTEAPVRSTPTAAPTAAITPAFSASPTQAVPMLTPIRTGPLPPPPLPGATSILPQATGVFGTACAMYVTYSGPDPANLLSLREQPGTTARQVFRVPNNTHVLLMPDSQEVEADGYHWLNVIYLDPAQNRYEGWIARDSYAAGGVRNPAISTLKPTGQQSPC